MVMREVILFAPTDGARRCEQIGDFTLLARMLLNITDVLVERDYQHERDDRTWVFGNFTRISVLALVLFLTAGVITENPLINLLFLLTVGCSIFAALVWFYGQHPRDGVGEAADTDKVKTIGMVMSHAAMLVAVIFVGSILLFVVAGIATVGFCGVADWSVCRVLFDPD